MEYVEPYAQQNDVSLRQFRGILRRRKLTVIGCCLLVFGAGTALTVLTKPLYRTRFQILVEGKAMRLAQYDANNPLSDLLSPSIGHDADTQVQVVQSDQVLADAFKAAKAEPGSTLVTAKQLNNTDVIEVSVESNDPKNAERVAKTLPGAYLKYVDGNRKGEVAAALSLGQKRLQSEERALRDAEAALQRFKEKSRIADLDKQREAQIKMQYEQNFQLQADQSKAQEETKALTGQLAALRSALKSQPQFLETRDATTNPMIDAVKDKIAQLKTTRANLLVLYKPADPKVQEVDAQIAEQTSYLAKLPAMTPKVTRYTNPALVTYRTQIEQAEASLAAKRSELAQISARRNRAELPLESVSALERQQGQLQRDVDRHKTLVLALNKAVDDLGTRQRAMHNPALTISPAGPARLSTKPILFPFAAAILGLLLGVGLAVLQEHADDRIHSAADVRKALTAPILAEVPKLEGAKKALVNLRDGGIGVHDSYRVLRANLQFAMEGEPTWSVAVSSTLPEEGKSLTAANLGIALALSGYRVVLVDADLREPSLHTYFNLQKEPGLTDLLTGTVSLEDALQPTPVRGLRVLSAGRPTPNCAELLASDAMRGLHSRIKDVAHVAVFDTPPVLAAADAQLISAETDALLYVVRPGAPTRPAVGRAMELVSNARANLLGLVLNRVDATDGEGYYGGYSYRSIEGVPSKPGRGLAAGGAILGANAEEAPDDSTPGTHAVALRRWPPVRTSAAQPVTEVDQRKPARESVTHTVVLTGAPATLEGLGGPYSGESFPMLGSRTVTVGRNPGEDISLSRDASVSRKHARIAFEDGGHVVYDEGSSNGTFVNNALVTARRLEAGDILRFGQSEFRYAAASVAVDSDPAQV